MRIMPVRLNYLPQNKEPNYNKNTKQTSPNVVFGKKYAYPKTYYVNQPLEEEKEFKKNFDAIISNDKKRDVPFVQNIDKNFSQRIEEKLKNSPNTGITIGITGKSASGKTTLSEKFIKSLEEKGVNVTVIGTDQYFKDTSELVKKAGSFANLVESGYEFDAPDNFRLNLLAYHLVKLANGESVKTPFYVGDGSGRCPLNVTKKEPNKVILVEGLAAHYPKVRDVVDAKIFIDIDEDVRKKRFLDRAPFRHPDWSIDQMTEQYIQTTKAADKYILPLKESADIVLNSASSTDSQTAFIDEVGDLIAELKTP